MAAEKKAKELGLTLEEQQKEQGKDNQIVLSELPIMTSIILLLLEKWKSIIKSRGEISKLKEIFGEEPPEDFDWTQYSIIRMPYELLPKGFMDSDQVARSKATVHTGIYQMEYGACFTTDSQGFFKRSLIESCVVNDKDTIKDREGNDIISSSVERSEG